MGCEYRKYDNVEEDIEFPDILPFENLKEVRKYLAGDKIYCLLCKRKFNSVGQHLRKKHKMETDTYREKFNIPYTYGLISRTLYLKCRQKAIELYKLGLLTKAFSKNRKGVFEGERTCVFRSEIAKKVNRDEKTGKFKK